MIIKSRYEFRCRLQQNENAQPLTLESQEFLHSSHRAQAVCMGGGLCASFSLWTTRYLHMKSSSLRDYLYWMLSSWKANLCRVRKPTQSHRPVQTGNQPGGSTNQQDNSEIGPPLLHSTSGCPSPHCGYLQRLGVYTEPYGMQFSLLFTSQRFDPTVLKLTALYRIYSSWCVDTNSVHDACSLESQFTEHYGAFFTWVLSWVLISLSLVGIWSPGFQESDKLTTAAVHIFLLKSRKYALSL